MGTEDHGDMRFHHRDGDGLLNVSSSVMSTNPLSDKVAGKAMGSASMFKAINGPDPFGSGWDPLVSLNQSENFGGHSSYSSRGYSVDNQAIGSSSHLVHYQSDSGLGEMVPKLSGFGSGSFSEMVNSYGIPDCGQMSYSLNKGGMEKALLTGTHSRKDCQIPDDKTSPDRKNKRKAADTDSLLHANKVQ